MATRKTAAKLKILAMVRLYDGCCGEKRGRVVVEIYLFISVGDRTV